MKNGILAAALAVTTGCAATHPFQKRGDEAMRLADIWQDRIIQDASVGGATTVHCEVIRAKCADALKDDAGPRYAVCNELRLDCMKAVASALAVPFIPEPELPEEKVSDAKPEGTPLTPFDRWKDSESQKQPCDPLLQDLEGPASKPKDRPDNQPLTKPDEEFRL